LLQKQELEKGAIYEVASTNFSAAVWTGEAFRGPAIIYGHLKFIEENHYEDGLPYGVCTPIRRISVETLKAPFDGANLLIVFRSLSELLSIHTAE